MAVVNALEIMSFSLLLSLQAEERKAAIRRIPEQAILGEVRRMVEEMQTLNKKLEETVSCKFLWHWFLIRGFKLIILLGCTSC